MTTFDPEDLITCHHRVRGGFPRPDWDAIERHIEENCHESQRHDAWNAVLEAWLEGIIVKLGERYWLGVSKNFLIVTSEDDNYARDLAMFLERALGTIMRVLDGIAANPRYGKHVAILFDSDKQYYRYISYFYPNRGEFASSAGIFIDSGRGHFALPQEEIHSTERVVAHELCHACVAHLPIPAWLNEGMAQIVEDAMRQVPFFTRDDRIAEYMERHREFWGDEEIQQFWSGESFARPDEGQELSYHLARLAVGALSHDYRLFKRYVLSAQQRDAGESALAEVFGGSLGHLMEQFLGQGQWAPDPDTWPDESDDGLVLLFPNAVTYWGRYQGPWGAGFIPARFRRSMPFRAGVKPAPTGCSACLNMRPYLRQTALSTGLGWHRAWGCPVTRVGLAGIHVCL